MQRKLFRNHAAGDAVSGVARGIGLLVVGLGVDNERCTAITEYRVAVVAPVDILIKNMEMRFAVRTRGEVGVVAGVVALRILQSMFLSVRIEMRPGRLEVGGVAFRILMKMDGMLAGRQILKIEIHFHSFSTGPHNRRANGFALGVLELNHNFGRTGGGERDHEQSEREQVSDFHGGIIAKTGGGLRAFRCGAECGAM